MNTFNANSRSKCSGDIGLPAKRRLITASCLLTALLASHSVLAETTIEADTEGATSYYYSLQPIETSDCSGSTFESGWVSTYTWTYTGELPSSCDYQATVWTNNQLKIADKSYVIAAPSATTAATPRMETMSSTSTTKLQTSSTANVAAMAFSIYSMLPDDTIMAKMFPKDLQETITMLMATYPGVDPKANARRLSTGTFTESKEKKTVDEEGAVWWCPNRDDENIDPFTDYENHCTKYDKRITLEKPDTVAWSNYSNTDLEPGVKNLVLFPGISVGFDYDWSLSGPSLTSYPMPSAYWVKGFAYFAVPVSGYYNFASQTKGGVRAVIIEGDGQEVSLLKNSSWSLNVDDDACTSGKISYRITQNVEEYFLGMNGLKVGTPIRDNFWIIQDPDGNVINDEDNGVNWVLYNMAGGDCSNAGGQSSWGNDVYLEAGQVYPLRVSMWAGWSSATLELKVKTPDGESRVLPMTWLSVPDAFDTENGWHAALESTASFSEANNGWVRSTTASGYNYVAGYTAATTTTVDEATSSINVILFTDDGNGWKQRGSLDMAYSGTIYRLNPQFSAAGDRLAIATNASLAVVDTSNPDSLSSVDVNLGNTTLSGAVALSYDERMGGRLAVSANDGVHVFDLVDGEWVASSTIANVNMSAYQSRALVFKPYSMNSLYIALSTGRVQRYDYDENTNSWSNLDASGQSNFDVDGESVALSDTGLTLAVAQTAGIDIYSTNVGERYVTTIIPPVISPETGLMTVDDYTLVMQGSGRLYVYNHAGVDWSDLDPNWRTIESPTRDGIDGSWLWIAHSGIAGATTIGVFPSPVTGLDVALYRLEPDDLKTLNGERVAVEITNYSDEAIVTTQFHIAAQETLNYVFWKGKAKFYTGDLYEWTLNDDANTTTISNTYTPYLTDGLRIGIDAGPEKELNIAPDASVTSSSEYSTDFADYLAVDGSESTEWASFHEQTPDITLTWATSQTITSVVIHDRVNTTDYGSAGTLTFSDGSSMSVSGVSNDGTGKEIRFAAKDVTWVKYRITSGSGTNVGLSEIEVYKSRLSSLPDYAVFNNGEFRLNNGESFITQNRRLVMQRNGNLVFYDNDGNVIWSSGTAGSNRTDAYVIFQNDGNLVIYSNDSAIWSSGTAGNGDSLYFQFNGDLVLNSATYKNGVRWDSWVGWSTNFLLNYVDKSFTIHGNGGKCLDVYHSGTSNGTNIQIYNCNFSGAQQWTVNTNGTISNINSGKCLDVSDGGTSAGTNVKLWGCSSSNPNQQWTINTDGTISWTTHSGMCLDSSGNSSGDNVKIWGCRSTNANQQWKFTKY